MTWWRRNWPLVLLAALAAPVATRIVYASWAGSDWSTEADASTIEVTIDKSPTALGAFPLGKHVDSSLSYDYQVRVSTQSLPDGRLYLNTREFREEGYTVELWITFVPNGTPTARVLVHWQENSGSTSGFIRNLRGRIRLTQDTPPSAFSPDAPDVPCILEYELAGDQRGRPVAIRRKLHL